LAGVLAQFVTFQTPFILAAFITLVGLLLACLLEGRSAESQRANRTNGVEKAVPKQDLALRRVVLIFGATNLLNGLLNGFITPVVSGMLMFKLGAAPAVYGLILSMSSSLITGLVQLPGGKLADRFGRKPLTLIGFLGVPLVLLLGFSRSLLDFSLILGGISAVGNISGPAISAWLMDLVPEHRRARVSGITQTLNGVGLTVGPNAGYYVWNSTKPDAVVPCGIAASLYIASLPFYFVLKEPRKTISQINDARTTPSPNRS
jgi:MFS family permease